MTISDLGAGGLVDIVDLNDGTVAATATGAWTASSSTDNAGAVGEFTIAVASAGAIDLTSAGVSAAGYTVTSTGTSAITGSAGADALTNTSGATTFTGGAGKDTITFAGAGTVEQVTYSAITDGGVSTGVDGSADSVVTFVSTEDKITLDGAIETAYDDQGSANDAIAWSQVDAATDGSAEAIDANDGTVEAIMLDGSELAVADFDDISAVVAELEEEVTLTAATGEDLLVVIEDTATNDFGAWLYVETGGTANQFDVADLTLLGIFTADAVAAGDFAIV